MDGTSRLWYAAGDPALLLYLRSSAKPLQAIPLVESGGADRLELTERELAVICGSHSGGPMHLEAVRRITRTMVAYPMMMSGTGRLCASVMAALGERLFCKTGGEAVFGIGLPAVGWGVGIKIADGNHRGMGPVVVDTLCQLGVLTAVDLDTLATQHRPVVRNHQGRAVGEIRPVFTLEEVS